MQKESKTQTKCLLCSLKLSSLLLFNVSLLAGSEKGKFIGKGEKLNVKFL